MKIKLIKSFHSNINHHGWSLSFGVCNECNLRYKDGYDKDATHKIGEYYFYLTFFKMQISLGFEFEKSLILYQK